MEVDLKVCAEILQSLCDGFARDNPVTRRELCIDIAGSEEGFNSALHHLAKESLIDIVTIPSSRTGKTTDFPILHEKAFRRIQDHGVDIVLNGLPKNFTW